MRTRLNIDINIFDPFYLESILVYQPRATETPVDLLPDVLTEIPHRIQQTDPLQPAVASPGIIPQFYDGRSLDERAQIDRQSLKAAACYREAL